jgi:hypothetical protein
MTRSRGISFLHVLPVLLPLLVLTGLAAAAEPGRYFKIQVVDDQTGRGVPLVELKTTANTRYLTDSSGIVAFSEPGLMDQRVFFHVKSHGYELPKDGFGFAGKTLDVKPGGSAQIKIKRKNIAERLYRVTGAGIYRDSVLLGEKVPIRRPLLNGQVTGQDTVMAVPYRGRLYWFWGDTNRLRYPLGLFKTSGATSQLPTQGGLDPSVGIDLEYFVDKEGFSRAMCPIAGPGAVWIDGLLTVRDAAGRERLVAHYDRRKGLSESLEHGLALYNDRAEVFEKHVEFDLKERCRCPRGHPIRVTCGTGILPVRVGRTGETQVAPGGTKESDAEYFLFPTPFATVRVKAQLEHLAKQTGYEAFTCLVPGQRSLPSPVSGEGSGVRGRESQDTAQSQVERDAVGKLVYAWKPGADPITQAQEWQLVAAGKIKPDEARFQVRDVDTQKPVELHGGTIHWNGYRKRWITIAVQAGGSSSYLGEVWFLEAADPTGPWRWAKKIITHDKYTFYNPAHHPFFDQDGGRIVYFEGTYANTFSGNPDATPWYDYNQVMYRLDLADPRLRQTN